MTDTKKWEDQNQSEIQENNLDFLNTEICEEPKLNKFSKYNNKSSFAGFFWFFPGVALSDVYF